MSQNVDEATSLPSQNEQRGKRRTARLYEFLSFALLAAAILNIGGTQDVFTLAFPACLTYAAALRGLDAKFA